MTIRNILSLSIVMGWLAVIANCTPILAQSVKDSSANKGYNAPWPKNRGFQVGQTVPDIPLFDMKGKEVRFSSFLGKQYVIYCWASW